MLIEHYYALEGTEKKTFPALKLFLQQREELEKQLNT